MSIPDFQTIMLPLLQIYADHKEHSIHECNDILKDKFGLTEEEMSVMIQSGKQTAFFNRVSWARTYLVKAGLLEMTRRTYYCITERGEEVLREPPTIINVKYLKRYPEFRQFYDRKGSEKNEIVSIGNDRTPEEVLEEAFQEIRENLAAELIDSIKRCSPAFFEQLVVNLLVKMGYGGSWQDAARAVGKSGDGGIDGIIDEDRLGLDTIYIQAKRWEGVVGRPEIQKFVGALMGKKAHKGVFITTSSFTADAESYVFSVDCKIVLIDGKRLANLLIDYDIGVNPITSYTIKRIDSDYFS